jgi:hypothetical protein
MAGPQQLQIPAGTTLRFGAPAHPMAAEIVTQLAELVAGVAGIVEAHLPMCEMVGSGEPPRQVLVLCFDGTAPVEPAVRAVGEGLTRILPPETYLDIWPLEQGHELLAIVRKAACEIHSTAKPRPWWRFWD